MTIDDVVNVVTDARRAQQREKYRGRDVITIPKRELTPWELSLRRVARAQAILWHRTGIRERMALLAEVEQELPDTAKGEGQ